MVIYDLSPTVVSDLFSLPYLRPPPHENLQMTFPLRLIYITWLLSSGPTYQFRVPGDFYFLWHCKKFLDLKSGPNIDCVLWLVLRTWERYKSPPSCKGHRRFTSAISVHPSTKKTLRSTRLTRHCVPRLSPWYPHFRSLKDFMPGFTCVFIILYLVTFFLRLSVRLLVSVESLLFFVTIQVCFPWTPRIMVYPSCSTPFLCTIRVERRGGRSGRGKTHFPWSFTCPL